MNLTGFDYYADCEDPKIGLTRTASLIRSERADALERGMTSLLFDNGDCLQGTPFGDWAAEQHADFHPLAQAFNALGYDAVGLGNHDLGFGFDLLDRFAEQLNCPLICSNLSCTGRVESWQKFTVLERQVWVDGQIRPLRIGICSMLPPQTVTWEAHLLKGHAKTTEIVDAGRQAVRRLRQEYCDLIVALAHSGLRDAHEAPGLENAVVPLAALEGIDALIAGHTHLTLPGIAHSDIEHVDAVRGLVHGKPTVMAGFAGSHLGVIDLTLNWDDALGWRLENGRASVKSVNAWDEDPEMVQIFSNGHAATRQHVAEPVGYCPHPMHSYFSFCAPDLGLSKLACAQAAALRPFLRKAGLSSLPVLSAAAPAKYGGRAGPTYYTDIPAGPISMRHVAGLHVFPNELRAVIVTGSQIRDWLEMSAGLFNQLISGQIDDLIDPQRAGHNFDILYGLSYQIDLRQPARFDTKGTLIDARNTRIRNVTCAGEPIRDDAQFVVATNNYRAGGGGHFPFIGQTTQVDLPSIPTQSILRDYISGALARDPLEEAPHPFSLDSRTGATVRLETGPGARKYLDELAQYRPELSDEGTDGFLRILLML